MTMRTIGEIGEKALISTVIKPRINPTANPDLAGDDCAIVRTKPNFAVCVSTDRVPADLISFRLGIIDHWGLGYYLAVLNLSDIAAMGAEPEGLLLNLGLPDNLLAVDFEKLIDGASQACREYGCQILGGDLSAACELSISATSIGAAPYDQLLRRSGASLNDLIYCTGPLGLTSTAFNYFLDAKQKGMRLKDEDEQLLKDQFRKPSAKFDLGRILRTLTPTVTCMDNTDGVGQTLHELCESNGLGALLHGSELPIHRVSREVAAFLNKDVFEVVLGPGADFGLIGTLPPAGRYEMPNDCGIQIVGSTTSGKGIRLDHDGEHRELTVVGWNYYTPPMTKFVE